MPISATTEESVNRCWNFLVASPVTINSINGLAMKLNLLKQKCAKYPPSNFVSQCIISKLVLEKLEPILDPTIRTYDQDFTSNCYSNLKKFSIVLMDQFFHFVTKQQ